MCDSIALRACIPAAERPPLPYLVRTSVTGHAINEASPFGHVGEVTKFTLLGEVMAKESAAAALVAQNLAMTVVNCALVALAPTTTALAVGAPHRAVVVFALVGVGFLLIGALAVLMLLRGIGRWPFWLLGKLPIATSRVDRWRARFDAVERQWRHAFHDRRSIAIVLAASVASRLFNIAEAALYFGLGGGSPIVAGGFLSLAGSIAIGSVMFFVPFQAGSAEVGADTVFRMAGLSSVAGVLIELARKLRRIVFVAIGVILLALSSRRKGATSSSTT